MFLNRTHAGHLLAERLFPYKQRSPLVLALPRGGVPVAYEVARALEAPLDVLVVRRLSFPRAPEVAMGAVVAGVKEVFLNTELFGSEKISAKELQREIDEKCREANDMERLLRFNRPPTLVARQLVLLIDDGMATGATMRVAIKHLRRANAGKIVVAVPVASKEAVDLIKKEADDVVCLQTPVHFKAVSCFYDDFGPITNELVTGHLDQARGWSYDHVLN